MSLFKKHVLEVVKKIPKGTTMSYKEVAQKAGNENAARAVGMILSRNNDTSIPCHRVIHSDGSIGAYNGLLGETKEQLLVQEMDDTS
jgi:O-6-methylguanine DNA methyltransferase